MHRPTVIRPRHLRAPALLLTLLAILTSPAGAQDGKLDRELPVDTAITTTHTVTVKGQQIPYRATVGTQPVYDEDGNPIASLFYTYYERSDISDRSRRPLVISFNGGPGSASVWMHIGYTGPRMVKVDDEGFPVQPYGVEDNPFSIIDVADVVFVNPVNVAFSRIIGDTKGEVFFGVNEDIEYLADWIDTFVNRHDRWISPKFLIGESYGTTRVSGLAAQLQDAHWMYLNGVILVSPTSLGIDRAGPVGRALNLPYMAATAWFHKALAPDLQSQDLEAILPEIERFTIDDYIPALARGGSLDDARRREIAGTVARYTGLSEQVVLDNNLAVANSFFWKELLRDQGLTVGRLDSRYRGMDRQDAGVRYDFDPALTAWGHSFAPAINDYLRNDLGFETDLQYWMFGPTDPWNRDGDETGEQLRQAMAQNPFLHLMVQAAYYDGCCDWFGAKYTVWNMDPAGRIQDRVRFENYRSGHMMYLRKEDLTAANEHIREFIATALEAAKKSAAY